MAATILQDPVYGKTGLIICRNKRKKIEISNSLFTWRTRMDAYGCDKSLLLSIFRRIQYDRSTHVKIMRGSRVDASNSIRQSRRQVYDYEDMIL